MGQRSRDQTHKSITARHILRDYTREAWKRQKSAGADTLWNQLDILFLRYQLESTKKKKRGEKKSEQEGF